jgi:hypothetical protein
MKERRQREQRLSSRQNKSGGLRLAKMSYGCKMNFLAQSSIRTPATIVLAGSLFSIQTKILGQPENRFFGRGQ